MNATFEYFMHGSCSLVACRVYEYLQDVTCSRSTVEIGVSWIDCQAIDESLVMSKLTVEGLEFVVGFVERPELDGSVVTGYKSSRGLIEEFDILAFLLVLVGCGLRALRSAFLQVPAYHLISVFHSAK